MNYWYHSLIKHFFHWPIWKSERCSWGLLTILWVSTTPLSITIWILCDLNKLNKFLAFKKLQLPWSSNRHDLLSGISTSKEMQEVALVWACYFRYGWDKTWSRKAGLSNRSMSLMVFQPCGFCESSLVGTPTAPVACSGIFFFFFYAGHYPSEHGLIHDIHSHFLLILSLQLFGCDFLAVNV